MRIGNAQKYADKILAFVKGLSESDSSFYDKTRDKLIQIGEMCSEIQQVISDTLETAKPRGFDPNTVEKTDEQISTLNKRVDKVETKVDLVCTNLETIPESVIPKMQVTPITKNPPLIQSTTDDNNHPKRPYITATDSKKVLHIYAKTLKQAAKTDHNNAVLNRCCSVIWHWFDVRILNRSKNQKYKFDVRSIKDYIAGLVISFGHHIELGDFERYADSIETWIDTDTKFIFPYEVKAICIDKKFDYANIAAMVLWNELYTNCGFDNLGRITLSSCKINNVRCIVHSLIGEIEDTLNKGGLYTNQYVQDSEDPDVLEKYHIV